MIKGQDLWNSFFTQNMAEQVIHHRKIFTYLDMPKNCYQLLVKSCEQFPYKQAFFDNWGHIYSYVDFKTRVDQFAYYLVTQQGIKAKDHVGLLLYNSIEFCIAFYAIMKLGAVAVPLPTKYRESELELLINRSDLNLFIFNEDFVHYFADIEYTFNKILSIDEQHGFGFRHLLANDDIQLDDNYQPDLGDIAIIMFTSGTTSQSKGVVLRHYNLIHAAITYQRTLGITSDDKTIIPIPIYHITGLSALLNLFVYVGGTIYLYRYYDAQTILACIEDNQITFMHGSSTVFSKLLDFKQQYPNMKSLRMIGCGSSYTPMTKLHAFHHWLPHTKFIVIYGMTETSSPALLFPDDTATHIYANASGIPIPGIEVKVTNEVGTELAVGQIGEIWLRGSVVCEEYFNMTTPLIDSEHWLNTGDIGYINEDHYVFVVDRKKDMINRGGEKIYCRDVENEMLMIEGISECAIVAINDNIYGEVAAAAIVLQTDSELTDIVIKQQLRKRLASYKIPEHFLFFDEIPKTTGLKIDKKHIRELFQSHLNQSDNQGRIDHVKI